MRYYVVLILTCGAAAQDFAIGVKGGVRATGDFEGSSVSSESKRYVVGPSVEIGLPARFSVEVDVLYRRFGYTSQFGSPFGSSVERGRADAREFSMLLKYRLPIAGVRPFVAAGYAPRRFSLSADSSGYFINVSTGARIPFSNSTHSSGASHGFVAGAGIEFHLARLRVRPEFRYTRWLDRPVNAFASQGYFLQSTVDQADIMLGLSWGTR
jgi:Outer membrane protein beta-barrel domain